MALGHRDLQLGVRGPGNHRPQGPRRTLPRQRRPLGIGIQGLNSTRSQHFFRDFWFMVVEIYNVRSTQFGWPYFDSKPGTVKCVLFFCQGKPPAVSSKSETSQKVMLERV